jgi:NDP-sugar pyrophosphorylase family protein
MRAMILAAGLGTRLRPLTDGVPKALVRVAGRPVMEHTLELLAAHGFRELYVNVHHHAESIMGHFGDGSRWGVEITYSHEAELLGTAGGVKKLEGSLGKGTFLVVSGDALTDLDLASLWDFHRRKGGLATLVLTPVEDPSLYGVVITDEDGRITGFQEKPPRERALSDLANSGIYVFEPEALKMIPADSFYDFGSQLFPRFLEEGRDFYGYRHSDYWNDVGSLEVYRQGNFDALLGRVRVRIPAEEREPGVFLGEDVEVAEGAEVKGPLYLGDGCRVERGAVLQGPLLLGAGTRVGEGARLSRSVLWEGCAVGREAVLEEVLAGAEARVEEGAHAAPGTVLGHRGLFSGAA